LTFNQLKHQTKEKRTERKSNFGGILLLDINKCACNRQRRKSVKRIIIQHLMESAFDEIFNDSLSVNFGHQHTIKN